MAEERTRIHTRIIPETEHKIAAAMPPSNCQTQNEFVKKALRFYCDYTSPQSCFSVLPPMLVAAIRDNDREEPIHGQDTGTGTAAEDAREALPC